MIGMNSIILSRGVKERGIVHLQDFRLVWGWGVSDGSTEWMREATGGTIRAEGAEESSVVRVSD